MKKILCCMVLMMAAMTISATVQLKAYSPPEQDIGYQNVATLSVDGLTIISFDAQFNIVEWQAPVTMAQEAINTTARVIDAYTVETPQGKISMRLECLLWPTTKNEVMILKDYYNSNYAHNADAYSFTASRADFS